MIKDLRAPWGAQLPEPASWHRPVSPCQRGASYGVAMADIGRNRLGLAPATRNINRRSAVAS
jgi:hypothetical protein